MKLIIDEFEELSIATQEEVQDFLSGLKCKWRIEHEEVNLSDKIKSFSEVEVIIPINYVLGIAKTQAEFTGNEKLSNLFKHKTVTIKEVLKIKDELKFIIRGESEI